MSSGSYAGPAGFNSSGWPAQPSACLTADSEPRGPGVYLAGLCVRCGRGTVHRNDAGHPQHRTAPQLGTCAACGEPMRPYHNGQRVHPGCTDPAGEGEA